MRVKVCVCMCVDTVCVRSRFNEQSLDAFFSGFMDAREHRSAADHAPLGCTASRSLVLSPPVVRVPGVAQQIEALFYIH